MYITETRGYILYIYNEVKNPKKLLSTHLIKQNPASFEVLIMLTKIKCEATPPRNNENFDFKGGFSSAIGITKFLFKFLKRPVK